ncbi:MAG: hypothetical protein M9965_03750 [Anaerolineae bacterium]|nr:hypothetical protein [Anaerolineae bacterium]
MTDHRNRAPETIVLALGVSVVLVGYLTIWLPNQNAGLSFIGVELGEWVKFLPEVRSGQVSASRNFFYIPPIALGLIMALFTAIWPNNWRTWTMRGLAVAVSLLAFPAVEAILNEPTTEWLLRLSWIGLVGIAVLAAPFLGRVPRGVMGSIVVIAAVGTILPLWAYWELRPIISNLLRSPVGIGLGVWLNTLGFALLAAAGLYQLRRYARS